MVEEEGKPPPSDADQDQIASQKQHEEVAAQLQELVKVWRAQRQQRTLNLKKEHPSDEALKQFDSSVKRNNALIKKLRLLSSETKDQLCEELARVNQAKYISEAVAAIADAPLKVSDVGAAVQVCSLLHQRYAEFSPLLIPALAKLFGPAAKVATDDERNLTKRRRSVLKLLVELLLGGVYSNAQLLINIIQDLAAVDFKSDKEAAVSAVTLLSGFVKSGREQLLGQSVLQLPQVLGLIQEEAGEQLSEGLRTAIAQVKDAQEALKEEAKLRFFLPASQSRLLLSCVEQCFESACDALLEEQSSLSELEQDTRRLLATRGELPEDVSAEYERRRKAYDNLQRSVSGLAEALQRPLPELVDQGFTRMGAADKGQAQQSGEEALPLFEDQETRAFYMSLPDLQALVPAVLLGDAADTKDAKATPTKQAAEDSAAGAAPDASEPPAATSPAARKTSAAAATPPASPATGKPPPVTPAVGKPPAAASAATPAADPTTPKTSAATPAAGPDRSQLDQLLSLLPSCVSRDLADEISVNFCYMNNKGARRRLVRALGDVPKAGMQLLPFYARVVASVGQVFPDVVQGVVSYLEDEFSSLLARKDPTAVTLEPRVRNARYLAELCKFRVLPPPVLFSHLKQLLDDFSHHNVDAAAAMVEACGPFLLRVPEARPRMENMLEMMNRLKNVRNLDSRQAALVESAYFMCKAPERAARQRRRRTPMQEYIRHLIFSTLDEGSISLVLKKLLKLPWAECERYVLKCLLKVVRGRFNHIPLIAALAGGLAKYRESIAISLVDCVLEDVRCGLEYPAITPYQKRVADVRLLGELYNYSLLDSRTIFDTLYLLLSFGHHTPEAEAALDPPDDYFRIRLACHLLDVCGDYFGSGWSRKRLDRFLTFFQAYILGKLPPLPLDVDFDLQDLLRALRPDLVRFTSLESALEAVNAILAEEAAAVASGLAPLDDDSDEEEHGRVRAKAKQVEEEEDVDTGAEVASDSDLDTDSRTRPERDEEFEKEFASLMHEYQGKPLVTMTEPPAKRDDAAVGDGHETGPSVAFKMLMKRGGKDDKSRELQVPVTASMAISLKQAEKSEAAERDEIKRLVLAANKREEQEQLAAAGFRPRNAQHYGRGYRQYR